MHQTQSKRWALPVLSALGALTLAVGVSAPAAYAAVTVPGVPTAVSANPGNASAAIMWTAPKNDGGSSITGYAVTTSPSSKGCTATTTKTCTLKSLINGKSYKVTVRARNKIGLSAPSVAVSVKAGVPLAPTAVVVSPGNTEAAVKWTAPANNGSAISKYTVTSSPGSKTCTTATTTCTVTVLTNGTPYRFTVTATNARGTGAASPLSSPVTPGPVQTIHVGGYPMGIASDGSHVWVASYLSRAVTELDAATGASMGKVADAGTLPESVSADGTHVWVANSGGGTVTEIASANHSVVHTITVGSDPTAISSDGTDVWVADTGDNTVDEIQCSTATVVNTVSVADPTSISSDGTDVWVAEGGALGKVAEIAISSTPTVVATIPVGNSPLGISAKNGSVWVSNSLAQNVMEIDASTATVTATIPVGAYPTGISSDGTDVWVANTSGGTVSEIDASTAMVVNSYTVGSQPHGVSADGTHVWVANFDASGTVSEIIP